MEENKFQIIFTRVKENTDIENLSDIARLVGIKPQTVSAKKIAKKFPADWAFIIAQKYGLSTDWIMTGQGPKRSNEKIEVKPEEKTIQLLDEWLKEISKDEPDKKIWFRYQIEEAFPGFREWLKRKEKEREDNQNRKVV